MRKFFESGISLSVTIISLLLSSAWYADKYEIEPLIGIIVSVGALMTSIVYRIFPEKKEDIQPIQIVKKQNSVQDSTINAGQNAIIGNQNSIVVYQTPAGERKVPHALTPPPFKNEVFLGRETELEYIHQKLFSQTDNLLLLVNGDGGVGKTSLASRYYHDHTGAYAHQAWLLSEKNIVNALLQLAMPLGVQFDERAGPTERLDVLLPALAELNAPCLLVIDNANEVEDLDATYQYLRRLPNFHLLLTTRVTNFEQAETYRIEGLPYEKALELFQKYYPKFQPGEEDLFRQIREAVAGNTLVIELLAKTLAQTNRLKTRYTLADLLKDLQDKGVLQLTQSAPVRTDYQAKGRMRHETPTAIIEAMYDLSELSAEERKLLSNFAVLPAESIGLEMLERLLGEEALEQNLLSLFQKGWIGHDEDAGSFKCSPVVQEIVRRKHAGLREDCGVLVDRLNDKLKYEGAIGHLLNATYEEALVFARYGETVVMIFTLPDYALGMLCERIGTYHIATGDLTKGFALFELNVEISKTLCASEPENSNLKNGLAISYSKIGETHSSLGNLDKALTFYEDQTKLIEELYEAYPQNVSFKNGLAISYCKLGETHSSLGNLDKALTFFEDETKLFEELYDAFPQNVSFKNGLAISYSKLGDTHSSLGNFNKALTFFEQYNQLEKALYDAYSQNVPFKNSLAISYLRLGLTYRLLGNLDKALTFYEQYNQLGKELYDAYPQNVSFKNGLALSYLYLGITYSSLGNLDKALTFFEQYNALEKELYEAHPQNVAFKNNLAISYQFLGMTHNLLGNSDKTLSFYEQYNQLEKELYEAHPQNVEFKNNLAISYQDLGLTHRSLGNLDKALTFFEQYNQLEKELYESYPQNVAFINGLALSYYFIGQLFEQQGNSDKAFEYFELSIKYMELAYQSSPQNAEFRKNLGISYRKMGRICEKTGKGELAKRYYEKAEELG